MDENADGRARARLRGISRGLTGKADFRLEVALAVQQLGKSSFTVTEVSALLPPEGPGRSDNAARNLQALVAAEFLRQPVPGGPYLRDERHPFWMFIGDTWSILLAEAQSVEAGEAAIAAIAQLRTP
jgi:hypothetical protein